MVFSTLNMKCHLILTHTIQKGMTYMHPKSAIKSCDLVPNCKRMEKQVNNFSLFQITRTRGNMNKRAAVNPR